MLPRKHTKIIEQLFILAQDVEGVRRAKLAACIVHKGKVISYGFNQNKTHPFQLDFGSQPRITFLTRTADDFKDQSGKFSLNTHAETAAIRNALKRISIEKLKECELYVCRVKKDTQQQYTYGLAKPCGDSTKGCTKAILTYGLKNVYYSTDEGSIATLF